MRLAFEARLYSGQSSNPQMVDVQVNERGLITLAELSGFNQTIQNTEISMRVGNSMRYLNFPDGSKLETRDNDAIDRLSALWQPTGLSFIHRLESNIKMVTVCAILLIAGGFLFVKYAIPALSAPLTAQFPIALDNKLGEEMLEQLDDVIFTPTTLATSRQESLKNLFSTLVPDDEHNFQINFRASKLLQANAFALPNGDIVFTDDMVNLSEDDEMLASIMLHEIGHVVERHAMQSAVRQAGLSILVFLFTGDISSAGSLLIVTLPNLVIYTSYSRDLEWSADTYALEQMLERGIDTNHFATIMESLMESYDIDTEQNSPTFLNYFSTHPATIERIKRFRNDQ